jgi:hypothetical protein
MLQGIAWAVSAHKIRNEGQRLILDVESGLESSLSGLGCAVLLLGVGTAGAHLENPELPLLWPGLVVLVGLALLALRSLLDDRVVLDFERRQVRFERKALGRVWVRVVAGFDDLQMAVLHPSRKEKRNQSPYWEYGVSLLTRTGKLIPLLSPMEAAHAMVCHDGRNLAKLLQIAFEGGEPERMLKVRSTPAGWGVAYGEHLSDRVGFSVGAWLTVVLTFAGVGGIFYLLERL